MAKTCVSDDGDKCYFGFREFLISIKKIGLFQNLLYSVRRIHVKEDRLKLQTLLAQ
jgi:hypothetical protein